MQSRKNFDTNEFEGHVKINGFPSKDSLIEKINIYLEKYKTDEKEVLYDIEKETSNSILLNFHKNTEIANYVVRKLKLLQMGNQNYSKLKCHMTVKVTNPNEKKEREKKEKENNEQKGKEEDKSQKKNKTKKNKTEIYNIDTKNNPKMNKLLNKSLNFNRKNMNKYMSPENNKMKIYESIFLNGGPYIDRYDLEKAEWRKNKAQWINKKGFMQYISKETISKNAHMIENYLNLEPAQPNNNINFRPIHKSKWVGKTNFFV